MIVFLVRMECSDYYCQREHVVAVRETREAAEQALAEARLTQSPFAPSPTAPGWLEWVDGEVEEIDTEAPVST